MDVVAPGSECTLERPRWGSELEGYKAVTRVVTRVVASRRRHAGSEISAATAERELQVDEEERRSICQRREDNKRGEGVEDADDDARMRPGIEEDCPCIRGLLIVYRGFGPRVGL
jgi:hypothetical protein